MNTLKNSSGFLDLHSRTAKTQADNENKKNFEMHTMVGC